MTIRLVAARGVTPEGASRLAAGQFRSGSRYRNAKLITFVIQMAAAASGMAGDCARAGRCRQCRRVACPAAGCTAAADVERT